MTEPKDAQMTDTLVERLGKGCNCGKCKLDLCCCATMEEAKDQIKADKARIIALEADVARLREALGNIRALAAKRQWEGGLDGNLAEIEGFALAALEARND